MSGRWWRAYDEAVDDPKLQQLRGDLFKAWFNVCCITSQNDGLLPAIEAVAFKLHVPAVKAQRILDELRSLGLIDDDEAGKRPHNWGGRQFQSDGSTPRVKRFRERKRNVPSAVSETPPDTEKEDTEGTNVPSAEDGFAERSDHERLRTSGIEWLAKVTLRKPQALQGVVGRWLKQTGDDAAAVLAVLRDARDRQIAEPIAWIEAALKAKPSPAQPPPMDWQERAEWYRKLGRWPAYWGSRDSVPKESRHLFPGVFEKLQVVSG